MYTTICVKLSGRGLSYCMIQVGVVMTGAIYCLGGRALLPLNLEEKGDEIELINSLCLFYSMNYQVCDSFCFSNKLKLEVN